MADSDAPDAPDATASHFDNLPTERLTTIVREALNRRDKLAAVYSINELRRTDQRFRELIERNPTIRSEFTTLRQETHYARIENAEIEANDPAGTRTAGEIIRLHDVDDRDAQDKIRMNAALRDIDAGMVARVAIARNRVQPNLVNFIKAQAADHDIRATNMVADEIIDRHDVDDPDAQENIRWYAALRDVGAGMDAQTAIDRNGVNPGSAHSIRQHAALRDVDAEWH
ncbi:hypothetical protein ACCS93_36980 [Rhizobium ruizarguesonis]